MVRVLCKVFCGEEWGGKGVIGSGFSVIGVCRSAFVSADCDPSLRSPSYRLTADSADKNGLHTVASGTGS